MSSIGAIGTEVCPLGFICQDSRQANCSAIRERWRDEFLLGDLHAGAYCPGGQEGKYENCPLGYYCPDPSTKTLCPAGFFCPHKTLSPYIRCDTCGEGSLVLRRENYGFYILFFFAGVAILAIFRVLFKKYSAEQYQRIVDVTQRHLDSVRSKREEKDHQKRLERIRPKLEMIAKRLHDDDAKYLRVGKRGQIKFDASKLFDELDLDDSGDLSYDQLNQVLQLSKENLEMFVQRMNEQAGNTLTTDNVCRAVFVNHFLKLLEETDHFGATQEEAAELFDEVALQGTDSKGAVKGSHFFTSSMSQFLSDAQINLMLKKLASFDSMRDQFNKSSIEGKDNRTRKKLHSIERDVFIEYYPTILSDLVANPSILTEVSTRFNEDDVEGFDIAFRNLSLTIHYGECSTEVVSNVTGRLESGTMTALMGGSGAGKTSLLNALCGRAFYGTTSGEVKINGHETSIEEYTMKVGFVPQDDIVFPELTVRENFIFAGKFQLPAGTPIEDIEDLADSTMADLGLSRVADSKVGNSTTRGVSGGEKKRVNIGLELMSAPRILFLDEPTSGLDASSALIVMQSLKNLVSNQGVTICSVIHQPRKFIFDLFDSLILLGIGGRMVYHGPTRGAEAYFNNSNYFLPPGESVADWLIDISSGRLKPNKRIHIGFKTTALSALASAALCQDETIASDTDRELESEGGPEDYEIFKSPSELFGEDVDVVGINGPSASKAEQAFEIAILRRENLYNTWNNFFANRSEVEMNAYNAPEPYALPKAQSQQPFHRQLLVQLQRHKILVERNWVSKLLDSILIIGAVVLFTGLEGTVELTKDYAPRVPFDVLAFNPENGLTGQLTTMISRDEMFSMFGFVLGQYYNVSIFGFKLGLILSILIGLPATKILTERRLEFFREAGSGYNVNAYFLSVNIVSTIEHSVQCVLAGAISLWLRGSAAGLANFYVTFLMLGWLCVSWALFLPLIVPSKNVTVVTGFFMAFLGLLLSGIAEPVLYTTIYDNAVVAILSGFFSPIRFFIESLAVGEYRCLPVQSGFTNHGENFPLEFSSFELLGLAGNDDGVNNQSCDGWYWGVLPALMVGLTVRFVALGTIHVSGRSKQAKKSLRETVGNRKGNGIVFTIVGFFALLGILIGVTSWLLLRIVE